MNSLMGQVSKGSYQGRPAAIKQSFVPLDYPEDGNCGGENPFRDAVVHNRLTRLLPEHKHIVQQYACYVTRQIYRLQDSKCVWSVMELCSGPDLCDYVQRSPYGYLSEAEVRHLIYQGLQGVLALKKAGFAHLDLSLENFLLHLSNAAAVPIVKVCDFGTTLACNSNEKIAAPLNSRYGKPNYMAPEVYDHQAFDGFAADMWSIGISILTALTGQMPYQRFDSRKPVDEAEMAHQEAVFQRFIQPDGVRNTLHRLGFIGYPNSTRAQLSEGLVRLLEHMLKLDPAQRPTLEQVLAHQWFNPERNGPRPSSLSPVASVVASSLSSMVNQVATEMDESPLPPLEEDTPPSGLAHPAAATVQAGLGQRCKSL